MDVTNSFVLLDKDNGYTSYLLTDFNEFYWKAIEHSFKEFQREKVEKIGIPYKERLEKKITLLSDTTILNKPD